MTLITYVFWKLQTVKDVVKQRSKMSRFRRLFDKQNGKRAQTLLKSPRYHVFLYLLITVNAVESEKVSLNYMENLGTVC